jgi:polysulfide reductase chain C
MKEVLNIQRVWDWKQAAYLFLVGMGAGAYLTGFAYSMIQPEFAPVSKLAFPIAAFLVIAGYCFLLADLGRKRVTHLAFLRPSSSWISRGTIVITIFLVLNLIHIGTLFWPSKLLEAMPALHLWLGSIASLFAVLTLIYTGLLLRAASPIPLWHTSFVPVLFLISGISTGIMGIALSLSAYGLSTGTTLGQTLTLLARYNMFIIVIEAIFIFFYLWRMYRLIVARISAQMMISGSLAALFWGGLVVVGLVVPFIAELLKAYLAIADPVTMLVLTVIATIPGLIGGFILRHIIIAAGMRNPLNVQGVLVPLSDADRVKIPKQVSALYR